MKTADVIANALRASRPHRNGPDDEPAVRAAEILVGLANLRIAIKAGVGVPDEAVLRGVGHALRLACAIDGTEAPSPQSLERGTRAFEAAPEGKGLPGAVEAGIAILKPRLTAWESSGQFAMTAEEAYLIAGALASVFSAREAG